MRKTRVEVGVWAQEAMSSDKLRQRVGGGVAQASVFMVRTWRASVGWGWVGPTDLLGGSGRWGSLARASANGSTVFPGSYHAMLEVTRARAGNNPSVHSTPDAE